MTTERPVVKLSLCTFAPDCLGNQIKQTGLSSSESHTDTHVASGDQMLYLKNVVESTTTKTVYLYAGSMLVATLSGGTYSYFHEDHLGDTHLVAQKPNSSVVVVFAPNHAPFGVPHDAA